MTNAVERMVINIKYLFYVQSVVVRNTRLSAKLTRGVDIIDGPTAAPVNYARPKCSTVKLQIHLTQLYVADDAAARRSIDKICTQLAVQRS